MSVLSKLFSGVTDGQAFTNVLTGAAMQYNKISDEKRAEDFQLRRDEKQQEADKDLAGFRARLEKANRLAAIREEYKLKTDLESKKPKDIKPALFRMDLSRISIVPGELKKNYVVGENINQRLKNINDPDMKSRIQLDAFNDVFDKNTLETMRNQGYFQKGGGGFTKLNTLENMIIGYYKKLSGKADIGFDKNNNSIGKITLAPPAIMQEMNTNHPFLFKKYLQQMGVKDIYAFAKSKGITLNKKPKSSEKEGVTIGVYDDAANNFAYYNGNSDPDFIETYNFEIENIDAGAVKGMGLADKKKYFDKIAQLYDQKNGGFMIRSAIELRQDLTAYNTPLQRPDGSTVDKIREYLENSPYRNEFIKNPKLALAIIEFALPNNIDDSALFSDVRFRGFFEGKPFEETVQGKLALESSREASRNKDLEKVGFSKPEIVNFKREAEVSKRNIARELKDLITKGVNNKPAFVGAAGRVLTTFKGAISQFDQFTDLMKSVFSKNELGKTGYTELMEVKSRALQKADQIAKLKANNKEVKAALLIDYYAEVLTFTMAATIQSGSDGSVDTRTISDADVKRIGNALRTNISAAIRGDTTVIDDIIMDANNKLFMLDSLTAPNRRKQSAAILLNRYLEDVSMFSRRKLLNYDDAPTAEDLRLKEIDVKDVTIGGKKIFKPKGQQNIKDEDKDLKTEEETNPFVNQKTDQKGSVTLKSLVGGN